MKILKLRFKNLNSLYGEWSIDFTDPEYISSGIFALTGPTGAGKSTVLDAICLALYGATPRLGKITKNSNEIMSRQSGECSAELIFESQAGRFLCQWAQRKARKSPDGKLQDQEHQIADADTGKLIETKKSLVLAVIEEKTGMDFDRFTRSILLAQGGFDTFLKAGEEQKSKILEQITGTEIYSKISLGVHERHRDEREKLHVLQAETSGVVILEPEQEKEVQDELLQRQNQEAELAASSAQTGRAIAWLTLIDELKKEITGLVQESSRIEIEAESFRPQRIKLEWALKAAEHEGGYATLGAIRRQQSEDQLMLQSHEASLPEIVASAAKQLESLEAANKGVERAKAELKAATPLIQRIRSLDQALENQQQSIALLAQHCAADAKKINEQRQARIETEKQTVDVRVMLESTDSYLNVHAEDEWLVSGLTGIEEQLANLVRRQEEISQKDIEIDNARADLVQTKKRFTDCKDQCVSRKQAFDQATKIVQQGADALSELLAGRLLREYRTEKETLFREIVYLKKIEALEDHRAMLEDGKPCPLCGSKTHPFAEENVPEPSAVEKKIESLDRLITRADELEESNRIELEAQALARNQLIDSEKLEAIAANDNQMAEKALAEITYSMEITRAGFGELKQAVANKLLPLGVAVVPESHIATLYESLKSRLEAWKDQVETRAALEKRLDTFGSEIKRIDAVIDTQSTALADQKKRLTERENEHLTEVFKRKGLYADLNPDEEERRLNQAVENAEKIEGHVRVSSDELQQRLVAVKDRVDSLEQRIRLRAVELKKAEADFLSTLEVSGFSNEAHFLSSRMTKEDRGVLSGRAKALEDAQTDLKARHKDRETRLELEIARKLSDKALEDLEPKLMEYDVLLQEVRDIIAGLRHKLSDNASAKERIKEKQSKIETQLKECNRWAKLHGLIGSADGKKYRNFAQGLTFELMVSHANRQLEKMTDRYLLIRDDERPLELNVIDNYQAGDVRSTKNLSGGESFIVSLTLALGLSKMSSRKVRVDSLFLDEGFGTLDEEALDTALEVLSGLHQEGKLIGVISHVSALKERISTQIQIVPSHGGRSGIAGPGCCKVIDKTREAVLS